MAERVVLVCDVCGSPAEESVTFKIRGRSLAKDGDPLLLDDVHEIAHRPLLEQHVTRRQHDIGTEDLFGGRDSPDLVKQPFWNVLGTEDS